MAAWRELSSTTARAFYRYLKALVDAGLGKRLMFGSDQMRWPDAIGWAVQAIEEAPFPSVVFVRRQVAYETLSRDGSPARL